MTAAAVAARLAAPEDTAGLTGSIASVRAQLSSLDLTLQVTSADGVVTDYHVVIANPKSRLLRSVGRYVRDRARRSGTPMSMPHPPVKSKRKGRR